MPTVYSAAELCICAHALAQPCPEPFGSNLNDTIHRSGQKGLFLNFENRAPCNGTVTAYNYCYYDTKGEAVATVFMVYRQNRDHYTLVDGSWHSVNKTQNQLLQADLSCEDEPLEKMQQFQVEENDIIAACIVDTSNTKRLRVLAENAEGHSLQRVKKSGNSDSCSPSEFNMIAAGNFEELSEFALHLFADIGKAFSQWTRQCSVYTTVQVFCVHDYIYVLMLRKHIITASCRYIITHKHHYKVPTM